MPYNWNHYYCNLSYYNHNGQDWETQKVKKKESKVREKVKKEREKEEKKRGREREKTQNLLQQKKPSAR